MKIDQRNDSFIPQLFRKIVGRMCRRGIDLVYGRSLFVNHPDEEAVGRRYFKDILPPGYDKLPTPDKYSSYYAGKGFYVSDLYAEVYEKWSGVKSDRYMSKDVYYCYVIPALNNMSMAYALTDKNGFSDLFPGINQPVTIAKNRNGIWFPSCDKGEPIKAILEHDEIIVKPSLGSECGRNVQLFRPRSVADVEKIISIYQKDFIVQGRVKQHPVMAMLNESSVNTVRLYTYRDAMKTLHLVDDCSIVRIGGQGAIIDNVSSGGGCCAISADGEISDRFLHEKTFAVESLRKRTGRDSCSVPNYEGVKQFALRCHAFLPYFDFIGWDIVVTESGDPLLLEFNTTPFCEGPQMAHGPMFGKYLDEIMSRLVGVKRKTVIRNCRMFANGNVLEGVY